jgi:hypothetical protein
VPAAPGSADSAREGQAECAPEPDGPGEHRDTGEQDRLGAGCVDGALQVRTGVGHARQSRGDRAQAGGGNSHRGRRPQQRRIDMSPPRLIDCCLTKASKRSKRKIRVH